MNFNLCTVYVYKHGTYFIVFFPSGNRFNRAWRGMGPSRMGPRSNMPKTQWGLFG